MGAEADAGVEKLSCDADTIEQEAGGDAVSVGVARCSGLAGDVGLDSDKSGWSKAYYDSYLLGTVRRARLQLLHYRWYLILAPYLLC